MVSATTAAPCSRTIGITFANRLSGPSPSSKLTELMTARPPRHSRPASMTGGPGAASMDGGGGGGGGGAAGARRAWRGVRAGSGRRAGEGVGRARGRLAHVDGPVAADVVDAQVDEVG